MKLEDKLYSPTELLATHSCERKHHLIYREGFSDFKPGFVHKVFQLAREIDKEFRNGLGYNKDLYAINIIHPLSLIIKNEITEKNKEELFLFQKKLNIGIYSIELKEIKEMAIGVIKKKTEYDQEKLDQTGNDYKSVFPVGVEVPFKAGGFDTRIDSELLTKKVAVRGEENLCLEAEKFVLCELKQEPFKIEHEIQMEIAYKAMRKARGKKHAASVGLLTTIEPETLEIKDKIVKFGEKKELIEKLVKKADRARTTPFEKLGKGHCKACSLRGACKSKEKGGRSNTQVSGIF